MGEKNKKKFDFPTQANTNGEFSVDSGLNGGQALGEKPAGDSVDEYNRMEEANAYLAKKEISQTFNNS